MDLFYRGFDSNDRIRSGAVHLSAAAARVAVSMVMSIPMLPEAAFAEFKRLLSIEVLWSLCLVLAGWVIVTIVGGLVGLVVNGLLIAYGVIELWEQLKAVAGSIKRWLTTAYHATTENELGIAGKHFAEALSTGGLTLFEIVITHRVFGAVEGKLRQAMPAPEWLKALYEEAMKEREHSSRKERKPTPKETKRPREAAKRVSEATKVVRDAGAKRAAEQVSMEAVAVVGALVVAAAAGGVALVLATSEKRSGR